MKYIIMCGGDYHVDTPRHLLEVRGEPIVARTIRLLKENGIPLSNIFISATDDRFGAFGVVLLKHNNIYGNGGRWLDAFYPTNEPVCYIFGDVVFSPDAIKTIVEYQTDSIMFFASAEPLPPHYLKKWAEPFAYKVADTDLFRSCITVTKHYSDIGLFKREPIAWELWQVIKGTPLNNIDYKNYIAINDYTCDCESPEQLSFMEGAIK